MLINLYRNEKTTISQLFDKEARKEKNLETTAREAKARKQPTQTQGAQTQGTQAAQSPKAHAVQLNTTADVDALLGEVEKEFFAAVRVQETNGKPK